MQSRCRVDGRTVRLRWCKQCESGLDVLEDDERWLLCFEAASRENSGHAPAAEQSEEG